MNSQRDNFNKENYTPQENVLKDEKILALEEEIEILREQVQSLKQELSYEYQRTNEYIQELAHANQELEWMNQEITNLIASNILPLDKPKEFTKSVIENKKSLTESVAELVNTIDSSSAAVNQSEPIDASSFKTSGLSRWN